MNLSDNGVSIVIMDTSIYIEQLESLLNNDNTDIKTY